MEVYQASAEVIINKKGAVHYDGLVHREIYKEIPPRVEYSLTDIGKAFIPVLYTLGNWGKTYLSLINKERSM